MKNGLDAARPLVAQLQGRLGDAGEAPDARADDHAGAQFALFVDVGEAGVLHRLVAAAMA